MEYWKNLSLEDLPGEEWKSVGVLKGIDYTGFYEVSNLGRVKSLDRVIQYKDGRSQKHKGVILSQGIHHTNYYTRLQVALTKNFISKTFTVARIVALAFIPNPENKPEVNHCDSNPLNNKLNNLEWVTKKENMQHALKYGKLALDTELVKKILKLYETKHTREISTILGISRTQVRTVLRKVGIKERTHCESKLITITEKINIPEMIKLYNDGESLDILGKRYNVSRHSIKKILMLEKVKVRTLEETRKLKKEKK